MHLPECGLQGGIPVASSGAQMEHCGGVQLQICSKKQQEVWQVLHAIVASVLTCILLLVLQQGEERM